MITLTKSILAINSKASFSIEGNNDVKNIIWLNDTTPIAEADILAKQKELQTAYDNNKYQRDREKEYPPIEEQLDMIYHSGQGGDEFQKAIKAVKDKYPKG